MNYSIIFKMLSLIMWVITIAFGICLGVSLYYSENLFEAGTCEFWISSIAITFVMGWIFFMSSRNAPKKIFRKEALCVIGVAWLLCSVIGAMPYMFIIGTSFADGFFESSSGLTTTGASIFTSFENFPKSILFWRSFSQWIGGLGVVVFFVAILSFLGAGAKILYSNEASADTSELDSGRVISGVRLIMFLYLSISALCLTVYYMCGLSFYDALCHMFSTVSTGGFSTKESSVAYYNSPSLEWAMIFFMGLCGLNFILLGKIARFKFSTWKKNTEFWSFISIIIVSSLVILFCIYDYKEGFLFSEIEKSLRDSMFQVVSIITTTGFSTKDYQQWMPLTHIILFFLILIGGCTGSTSGGIKVARIVAAFKLCKNDIEKQYRPNVVRPIVMNGSIMRENDRNETLSFIVMFVFVFIFAILLLSVFEPKASFTTCISGVAACISNVGPALEEFGPTKNFGWLSDGSKILLSVVMIMGRLELFAILVLFSPSFWREFR